MDNIIILDARCPACEEKKLGHYDLNASCGNCGYKFSVRQTKGHKTFEFQIECPYCGVSGSVFLGKAPGLEEKGDD